MDDDTATPVSEELKKVAQEIMSSTPEPTGEPTSPEPTPPEPANDEEEDTDILVNKNKDKIDSARNQAKSGKKKTGSGNASKKQEANKFV